jgi:hypothetical protein
MIILSQFYPSSLKNHPISFSGHDYCGKEGRSKAKKRSKCSLTNQMKRGVWRTALLVERMNTGRRDLHLQVELFHLSYQYALI